MNDALTWILDAVQGVDPVLRTVLAGIAIMLETSVLIGLIVPGDTVVLVAATGVSGTAQYLWMVAVIIVGALIGESFGFLLGRLFGPRIRASWVGRRIGERNWDKAEGYLERRGGIAVFLSRFLPVLHSLIPLTVGMSGMSYRRFIAWTTPACVIWSAAYVSVGAGAAEGYRQASDTLHSAGYFFVGAIVVFIILIALVKKLIAAREARHMSATAIADAADVDAQPEPPETAPTRDTTTP